MSSSAQFRTAVFDTYPERAPNKWCVSDGRAGPSARSGRPLALFVGKRQFHRQKLTGRLKLERGWCRRDSHGVTERGRGRHFSSHISHYKLRRAPASQSQHHFRINMGQCPINGSAAASRVRTRARSSFRPPASFNQTTHQPKAARTAAAGSPVKQSRRVGADGGVLRPLVEFGGGGVIRLPRPPRRQFKRRRRT